MPQQEETDCGLASLAMVCLRLGAKVSVEELRQKVAPGPQGLSLQQLRQAATRERLLSGTLIIERSKLPGDPRPVNERRRIDAEEDRSGRPTSSFYRSFRREDTENFLNLKFETLPSIP